MQVTGYKVLGFFVEIVISFKYLILAKILCVLKHFYI
jgi:hypothetical protein